MVESVEEINLTGKNLQKLTKATTQYAHATTSLILDNNELQKLDNIDSYVRLEKLSVNHNQLLRMYGVCRLCHLRTLDLSHNGILTMEGLRDLVHLTHLNLSNNNIKTIEHLQSNYNLEVLDLSHNNILSISDLSHLTDLKQLHLHGNRIVHLRQCDKFLPISITTLTLAHNSLGDLNEISQLVHLDNLVEFTIESNPCVSMTGGNIGFDYRPFIINWIMSIKVIDGYVVTPIESLKAEWLYSQGRGRQFSIGEQQSLCRYLAVTCPLSEQALETEDHRKLRLILSKAQQHQQQLKIEQMTNSTGSISTTSSPCSSRRHNARVNSPRINNSRLSAHCRSPINHMTNSYHGTNSHGILNDDNKILANIINSSSDIMTQSLDSALNLTNANTTATTTRLAEKKDKPAPVNNQNHFEANDFSSPLHAAKKLVPVPESLMSPDVQPTPRMRDTISNAVINLAANQITKTNIPRTTTPKGSPKTTRSTKVQQIHSKSSVASHRSTPSPSRQRKTQTQALIDTIEPAPPDIAPNSQDDNVSSLNTTIDADKLEGIRKRAQIIQQQKNSTNLINQVNGNTIECIPDPKLEQHAVLIQKIWRGYHTRNLGKHKNVSKKVNESRMREYIEQLTSDMAATKTALESERKIQQLQMQAISALWKRVSHLPSCSGDAGGNASESKSLPPSNSGDHATQSSTKDKPIKDLEITCSHLQNQVRDLQNSMDEVMQYMGKLCQNVPGLLNRSVSTEESATQTDLIAVHTPQDDLKFPFGSKASRPSSLPLPISQQTQTIECDNKHMETQTTLEEKKEQILNDTLETDMTEHSVNKGQAT